MVDVLKPIMQHMESLMTIRDYDQLRAAINDRRIALRMKCLDVDVDAELQSGYYAKINCKMRNFGPANLEGILRALNVELRLVERPDDTAPRIVELPKKTGGLFSNEHARLKKIGAIGRKNFWENIPPEKRSQMMRDLRRSGIRKQRQRALITDRLKRKRKNANQTSS
jgi:hypothetical protein